MPHGNLREVQLEGLDGVVVPLDGKEFPEAGHRVAERRPAATGEERHHGRRIFRLRLEVLPPAGLEVGRVVFYFGKECPHLLISEYEIAAYWIWAFRSKT